MRLARPGLAVWTIAPMVPGVSHAGATVPVPRIRSATRLLESVFARLDTLEKTAGILAPAVATV